METIKKLTAENISEEHICCAISDKKCLSRYNAKKEWLKNQFKDGYVFKKLNVRGKVFIEYVPAKKAWVPIVAPNYMLINCFWVSGRYKGQGHGKSLYKECEKEAKKQKMDSIVVVVGDKKRPFLSDKKFFQKQGFQLIDKAKPYFELWYKPFSKEASLPRFKEIAKMGVCDIKEGLAIYYTHACPFTDYYVAELAVIANERGYNIQTIKLESREQAQNHFVPHTIYSVFQDGKFITQHIISEKNYDQFIKSH